MAEKMRTGSIVVVLESFICSKQREVLFVNCSILVKETFQKITRRRVKNSDEVICVNSWKITTLLAAMMTASTEVVTTNLNAGANVESVDVMGNDGIYVCIHLKDPRELCSVGLRESRTGI